MTKTMVGYGAASKGSNSRPLVGDFVTYEEGEKWDGKCVYVWFEAVQGYSTCARIWAQDFAAANGHEDGANLGKTGGV